ncbi:type I secretion system permease/ATPase [Microbulbifer flavimaris]|uniref:Type I secretion system permease/ATPase n=1 Tax=Microbulbifer flavimaris TaxID=1781068 RepID=A0ABX4HWT5_9GAMM|nr:MULTISPECIES: type I secretion system permease/ATPase [Microbulbifer]KUJ81655.1 ATP-binding protein [Microbulbifer sp. ZGT114]PCO04569.1 type I secretion system permease/ATPase [Microbulbifer flavimaris]
MSQLDAVEVNEAAASDQNPALDFSPWLEAVLTVARHYRLDCSEENIRIASASTQDTSTHSVLLQMARQAGMTVKTAKFEHAKISAWRLPLVIQTTDGQVGVIEGVDKQGVASVTFSGDQGLASTVELKALQEQVRMLLILRPRKTVSDARVDDYIKPQGKHWFRSIILRDLKPYTHVMLATTVANTLALAGILFSKQVYDRVIPAESMPTLYVLFSGVCVAVLFDFIMRLMRTRITDLLGKRADIRVSDLVYGHAVRLRNSARPKSTGTFISQIRELERVREMVTSTTVLAIADMPFFFLFLAVLWMIAGPLVLVPLVALLLLLIPGLLAQGKLARLSAESMRESSLRNAMLVESVQGMEDIKVLQAEQRFQQQWNHFNAVTADSNLELRYLVSKLVTWTHNVQSSVFAVIVLFGAPMVMAGDLTTGALVAASILGSRMMSPIAQVTQILSRWQQARMALKGLDQIMQLPVDHAEGSKRVHKSTIHGDYEFRQAAFSYDADAPDPALQVPGLVIRPGEKIAVLGRNGAGKSTLLQAMAGLLENASGLATIDGIAIDHLDPADLRRDIGLLSQNSTLFHGTLRENLTLGAPQASDEEILWALKMSCAEDFVRRLPRGLDHMVLEGGKGLSGGQRQSLLLSRLLIRQPQVLLLDEPSASLDEATERRVIDNLSEWIGERTLILATHRASTLRLVDRIVVVDAGRVLMDGGKEEILTKLSQPAKPTPGQSSAGKSAQVSP